MITKPMNRPRQHTRYAQYAVRKRNQPNAGSATAKVDSTTAETIPALVLIRKSIQFATSAAAMGITPSATIRSQQATKSRSPSTTNRVTRTFAIYAAPIRSRPVMGWPEAAGSECTTFATAASECWISRLIQNKHRVRPAPVRRVRETGNQHQITQPTGRNRDVDEGRI